MGRRISFALMFAAAMALSLTLGPGSFGQEQSGQLAASENPLELIKTYEGKPIDFSLDICAFKLYEAPGAKIEVYYDIPNTELKFQSVVSGELATSLIIAVRILDKEGKVVNEAANRGSTRIKTEKEATDPALSSKFVCSFNLEPGDYVFKVGVKDNLAGRVGVKERQFSVKSIDKDQLALSSVEFARDVQPAQEGETSGFLKEGLNMLVTPHPSRQYQLGDSLSVYFNIYNLKVDNSNRPRFNITYKFKREGDRKVMRCPKVQGERKEGGNQSHLYSFKLSPKFYKPGDYTLFITVTDELSTKGVETKEPFKIAE